MILKIQLVKIFRFHLFIHLFAALFIGVCPASIQVSQSIWFFSTVGKDKEADRSGNGKGASLFETGKGLISNQAVHVQDKRKNKLFDRKYNLRDSDKLGIMQSLTETDCVEIRKNDNPRSPAHFCTPKNSS